MTPKNPQRSVRFGLYEADFHTQELRKQGMKLKLSGQPLQILQMLLARPGELVTREELQKQLWTEGVYVDSNHGLNAAVNKLRDALNDSVEEPRYIETLPRRGYRFIGTILEEPAPAEAPAAIPPVPSPISLASTPVVREMREPKGDELREVPFRQPAPTTAYATASYATTRLRSRTERRFLVASAAMLLLAVTSFLRTKPEVAQKQAAEKELAERAAESRIAENMLKPVPPYASENLSPVATNSQQQGDAGRRNESDEGGLNRAEVNRAEVNADHKRREESLLGRAYGTAANGDLPRAVGVPQLVTVADKEPPSPMQHTVIADDRGNAAPQFSPDGRRIAYMSTRSGEWQIWVSNIDGSNARQVSFTESAGTPRWSPDGRSIAFDAPYDDETRIFVVAVDRNEQARPIVKGLVPSFSRDGKWIYFASDQNGDWQVWKVPVAGGTEVQMTTKGGFAALESADGYVYYSKSKYPHPEICRVSPNGGSEECGLQHLQPRTWASWAVTREGIVFAEDLSNGHPALSLYDPAKRQVRDLVSLRSAPFWVGASLDGKRAIMNDAQERQISMVDNLQ